MVGVLVIAVSTAKRARFRKNSGTISVRCVNRNARAEGPVATI
jgi:hypothetical protein